jgi:hypothetical protein
MYAKQIATFLTAMLSVVKLNVVTASDVAPRQTITGKKGVKV